MEALAQKTIDFFENHNLQYSLLEKPETEGCDAALMWRQGNADDNSWKAKLGKELTVHPKTEIRTILSFVITEDDEEIYVAFHSPATHQIKEKTIRKILAERGEVIKEFNFWADAPSFHPELKIGKINPWTLNLLALENDKRIVNVVQKELRSRETASTTNPGQRTLSLRNENTKACFDALEKLCDKSENIEFAVSTKFGLRGLYKSLSILEERHPSASLRK